MASVEKGTLIYPIYKLEIMMFPEQKTIDKIKQIFRKFPEGTTISEISAKLKMNRNLVAKYLEHLRVSGQLEMKTMGSAKIFSISRKVPVASLINYSSDPVMLLDSEHHMVRVNDRMLAAIGSDREEFEGKCIRDSDNPFLQILWKIIRSQSRSTSPGEGEFITLIENGKRNFRYHLVPIVFEDGSPGTGVVLNDVTADILYREIRQTGSACRDGLYADMDEMVAHFIPDGVLTEVNDTFCRFFQREKSDCIGHDFRLFFPPDDQRAITVAIQSLKHDRPVTPISCRMLKSTNQIRLIEGTVRAIFNEHTALHEYLAVFRDVNDKQEALTKIDRLISGQARLYLTAFRLSNLPPDANIFDAIGAGLKELLPAAIIAINTFDPETVNVTTRSFLGDREREVFSRYIGRDIVGFVIEYSDPVDEYHVIQNVLGGKLIKVPGDLHVMFLGQVSREICRKIEEDLDIGDMYVIAFVTQKAILGNAAIMLRKGDVILHPEVIEIFARQATLALKCRQLEEGKKMPLPLSEEYHTHLPPVRTNYQ
jgi:PAS domain-containing protein